MRLQALSSHLPLGPRGVFKRDETKQRHTHTRARTYTHSHISCWSCCCCWEPTMGPCVTRPHGLQPARPRRAQQPAWLAHHAAPCRATPRLKDAPAPASAQPRSARQPAPLSASRWVPMGCLARAAARPDTGWGSLERAGVCRCDCYEAVTCYRLPPASRARQSTRPLILKMRT